MCVQTVEHLNKEHFKKVTCTSNTLSHNLDFGVWVLSQYNSKKEYLESKCQNQYSCIHCINSHA